MHLQVGLYGFTPLPVPVDLKGPPVGPFVNVYWLINKPETSSVDDG